MDVPNVGHPRTGLLELVKNVDATTRQLLSVGVTCILEFELFE